MLVAERYEIIVQLVNEKGSVRVTELAQQCNVTEETIRRDLDRLEKKGRLLRSHGGAVSIKDNHSEIPFFVRETTNVKEKKKIAYEAIKHIQPYDRIFLDASTSAWFMASEIPDMPLTVLTNSIKVTLELSMKEKIDVISTGGLLSRRSLSYLGPLAEQSLEEYYVDKAFMSSKGIHLNRGISESNELQARLKKKMIDISDQIILIADSSKFGVQALTRIAKLDQVHFLITDQKIDAKTLHSLKEQSIEVTTV